MSVRHVKNDVQIACKAELYTIQKGSFAFFISKSLVETSLAVKTIVKGSPGQQKSRPLVLVLETEMPVLIIVNLYLHRTSSQRIAFLISRTGAGLQVNGNSNQIAFIPQKRKWPLTASIMSKAENCYLITWVNMSSTFCKRRFS